MQNTQINRESRSYRRLNAVEPGTILELDCSLDTFTYCTFDYDRWVAEGRKDPSDYDLDGYFRLNENKHHDFKSSVILLEKWERAEDYSYYRANLLGIFIDCTHGKYFYENAEAICSCL